MKTWAWWVGVGVMHLGDEDGPWCGQKLGPWAESNDEHRFYPEAQDSTKREGRYCRRCLKHQEARAT